MTPIKRGDIYYAVWTCVKGGCTKHAAPRRHWASLETGDKREAKAMCDKLAERLAEERVKVKLGLPVSQKVNMTLGGYRELYLEATASDKAPSTHQTEIYHLGALIGYLGEEFKLENLSQTVLEGFKRYRLGRTAPRSWNSELATLKSVFAWGLRREPQIYAKNPFDGISRVDKGVPTVQKYISRGDIQKVMEGCQEAYWRNVIAFLYCTFCRGSELRGLKWADIDLEAGTIEFKHPKERRKKIIPITPIVRSILYSAKEEAKGSEYVFPCKGTKLKKDWLHHKLQSLGRAVGVKLSPHMLRHSSITDALKAGAPLFAVQKQAGHSQITTTAEYGHMDLDSQRGAMEKLAVSELYEVTR